jgi:hypothetical protein
MKPATGSGPAPARPDLDQQSQHIRLGEMLDDTVAAEMQEGDAGQRDGRSLAGTPMNSSTCRRS